MHDHHSTPRERDRDEDRESAKYRDASTERWRGGIDANLKHVVDQLRSQGVSIERIAALFETYRTATDKRFGELELKVNSMAQRMAVYTGIAAFIGSGLMSGIIALIFKK